MHSNWTRRHFLGSAAAAVTLGNHSWSAEAVSPSSAQEKLPPPSSQANSPEIISGSLRPLLESNVARPLRYKPSDGGFSITNGSEFFNRPLYGPNIPFRVDSGDRPEFSLYLPGHGGNLRLGFALAQTGRTLWAFQCAEVNTTYLEGRLQYVLRDPAFTPQGIITIEALTDGPALWVRITAAHTPDNLELVWAFGGVSGRKGKRNGDIGCEVEPVSRFFQLRPQECIDNHWTIEPVSPDSVTAQVTHDKIHVNTAWPPEATLKLSEAAHWNDGWQALWHNATPTPAQPVLIGRAPLTLSPALLSIEATPVPAQASSASATIRPSPSPAAFEARKAALQSLACALAWSTPDPFLDSMAGALNIAADAIWDDAQGCVMHGAVAWRMPLAGWRGPYALDVTGAHTRMRRHLRHWIARQNTAAVTKGASGESARSGFRNIVEARGEPDAGSRGARTENLLHSSGDLSHNHYDMNLVFFDALLRHLGWTGDLDFAREAWPALERHAAWERRLFRRNYGTEADPLPLYEAYAAIWASDNLQYNGGGATHSSAYNLFLNRHLAELASRLGLAAEVATAYNAEADAIGRAMRKLLWMGDRGAFAESRDWLAERQLAEDPAAWTMYHTIDSEVTSPLEAWQMAAERKRALRKVPVCGDDVPADAGYLLPCSDWHPYVWSLTLLVTAENLHTALALFQAGMADEAYGLLRGTLLDAGFRGLCPGNFPMSLQLDPHRQESQRDFGDPVGCASRAIVEGLWGVQPDLLNGKLRLRPQLPLQWPAARLSHPGLEIAFHQQGTVDTWTISTKFPQPVRLSLELRARATGTPQVRANGRTTPARFLPDAIGEPRLLVDLASPAQLWTIDIEWHGQAPIPIPAQPVRCDLHQRVSWPVPHTSGRIEDPQQCLRNGFAVVSGNHTVFLLQHQGSAEYWLPVEVAVEPSRAPSSPLARGRFEPVPLSQLLNSHAADILSRPYNAPRPGLCSLNLPSGLLGGWANFDVQARISDAGFRTASGSISIPNGPSFSLPTGAAPNCRFSSHWALDTPHISVPLQGHARAVHLLLVGTTFPQATRTPHATLRPVYAGHESAEAVPLRSPNDWWPVEQDYLLDDFIFRLDPASHPALTTAWRVDLQTGKPRPLSEVRPGARSGNIPGGSAFVVRLALDPEQELRSLELHTPLYGIVLGLLAVTLERQ